MRVSSIFVSQAADPDQQQQNNSRPPTNTQRRSKQEGRGVECEMGVNAKPAGGGSGWCLLMFGEGGRGGLTYFFLFVQQAASLFPGSLVFLWIKQQTQYNNSRTTFVHPLALSVGRSRKEA